MLRTYNAVLLPLRAIGSAWSRLPRGSEAARAEWRERWARELPLATPGGWWIHGASLGEARLVAAIAAGSRGRRADRPVYVSAVTRSGREALPGPPVADAAFFAPLDFRGLPSRVLAALAPTGLALVETELWPNLVHEARTRRVPVAIANGRLSEERMARYRRWHGLYRGLLASVARVGAQSDADAERFETLGVAPDRIAVTGNLKYDLPGVRADRAAVRARLGLAGGSRPVLVAGSTAEGEDGPVLEAFVAVRRARPDALLVLAPRHAVRVPSAETAAARHGLRTVRLSELSPHSAADRDVVVVDTVGDLAALYAAAEAAFVGGSLVPIGGHNVLEPAAAGSPVLFGPHTGHVDEPARALLDAGGAARVGSASELAGAWGALLADADRRDSMAAAGRTVVERGRGSLARTLDLLESAFAGRGTP